MSDKLQQAIKLIKSGERQKAGQILTALLKTDPSNETAWLWLSLTVTDKKQQHTCLEKVLEINPDNEQARQALAELERPQKGQPKKQAQLPRKSLSRSGQIGIVAVLALIACCIFGVVGLLLWLPAPETVVADQPATQPPATNTEEPTATPVPTATPQPTATSIPGWKKMEGGPVELWLPASYEGGDTQQNMSFLVEGIKSMGAGYEPFARMIEQDPSLMPFSALDTAHQGTVVAVTRDEVPPDWSLDTVMDELLKEVSKQSHLEVKVSERKIVSLDNYQAGQLLLEVKAVEWTGFELLYFIREGNHSWTVFYYAPPEQIGEQLPVFQQSIQTFRLKL
jgi:hypothetical protein